MHRNEQSKTRANDGGLPLPSDQVIEAEKRVLFDRTKAAADAGARLVVWTEAAIGIDPINELTFRQELSQLSRSLEIELIAAYKRHKTALEGGRLIYHDGASSGS